MVIPWDDQSEDLGEIDASDTTDQLVKPRDVEGKVSSGVLDAAVRQEERQHINPTLQANPSEAPVSDTTSFVDTDISTNKEQAVNEHSLNLDRTEQRELPTPDEDTSDADTLSAHGRAVESSGAQDKTGGLAEATQEDNASTVFDFDDMDQPAEINAQHQDAHEAETPKQATMVSTAKENTHDMREDQVEEAGLHQVLVSEKQPSAREVDEKAISAETEGEDKSRPVQVLDSTEPMTPSVSTEPLQELPAEESVVEHSSHEEHFAPLEDDAQPNHEEVAPSTPSAAYQLHGAEEDQEPEKHLEAERPLSPTNIANEDVVDDEAGLTAAKLQENSAPAAGLVDEDTTHSPEDKIEDAVQDGLDANDHEVSQAAVPEENAATNDEELVETQLDDHPDLLPPDQDRETITAADEEDHLSADYNVLEQDLDTFTAEEHDAGGEVLGGAGTVADNGDKFTHEDEGDDQKEEEPRELEPENLDTDAGQDIEDPIGPELHTVSRVNDDYGPDEDQPRAIEDEIAATQPNSFENGQDFREELPVDNFESEPYCGTEYPNNYDEDRGLDGDVPGDFGPYPEHEFEPQEPIDDLGRSEEDEQLEMNEARDLDPAEAEMFADDDVAVDEEMHEHRDLEDLGDTYEGEMITDDMTLAEEQMDENQEFDEQQDLAGGEMLPDEEADEAEAEDAQAEQAEGDREIADGSDRENGEDLVEDEQDESQHGGEHDSQEEREAADEDEEDDFLDNYDYVNDESPEEMTSEENLDDENTALDGEAASLDGNAALDDVEADGAVETEDDDREVEMDDIYAVDIPSIPASPVEVQHESFGLENEGPIRLSAIYAQVPDFSTFEMPPSPTITAEVAGNLSGPDSEDEEDFARREPVRFSCIYRQSVDWTQALSSPVLESLRSSISEPSEEATLSAPILDNSSDPAPGSCQLSSETIDTGAEQMTPVTTSPLSPLPPATPPADHGDKSFQHDVSNALSTRAQPTPPPETTIDEVPSQERRGSGCPRTFDEMNLAPRPGPPAQPEADDIGRSRSPSIDMRGFDAHRRSLSQRLSGWWSGGAAAGPSRSRTPPPPLPYDSRYGEEPPSPL